MNSPRYEVHLPYSMDKGWVRIEGGRLAQPVEARFSVSGVALRLTALRVENDEEINSSVLRSIRAGELASAVQEAIAEVLAQLEGEQAEHEEWLWRRRVDPRTVKVNATAPVEYLDEDQHTALMWAEAGAAKQHLEEWLLASGENLDFQPRTRGMQPPTQADYRKFALIYLDELRKGERGAKRRTADRAGMSRQTAYKWISECDRLGLLRPSQKGNGDA